MKLSDRIQNVSASPTIAITAKANQMKKEGIDIVSFGAGEPDFDTPSFIVDACIEALKSGDTRYVPKKAADLKKAITAKLAKENNINVEPAQVLVTFGGKHALYDAFQAVVNPGDKVLLPTPYWVSYPEQIKLAGGEVVYLEAGPEQNFKITPQQILDNADAKVIVINSPSNPSGLMYTPAELKALADAVLKTDMIVFSDEIYEKLVFGDNKFVSFAALDPRLPERTVTFNGLAKTYAMTGWRLGWAAGPKNVISAMACLMSHETTDPVSFAQAGAYAAYTDPRAAETIEKMRLEFERRGKHMAARLNAMPGVSCIEPQGAFYCFPDVSKHYGKTLAGVEVTDSLSFARAALEGVQVAIVPGVAFGEDRCIRLSFATSIGQINKGLDRLEKLLK
jgi:aspartate aminotransferase